MPAETLKDLRQSKNLTQEELAELSGLTQATISRLESGEVGYPILTTADKLSKALGVSLSKIVSAVEATLKENGS